MSVKRLAPKLEQLILMYTGAKSIRSTEHLKDVAYFMGSCLDSGTCLTFEEQLLGLYFEELRLHLPAQLGAELEAEWR